MAPDARRKVKTKKREKNRSDSADVTKEEYAVAKHLRFNCPTKQAMIMGDEMSYFTANKAVDCLVASKWAGDGEKKLFSNRHGCVFYMQTLLDKGLFFRAKKLVPKKKDVKQVTAHDAEAKVEPHSETTQTKLKDENRGKDGKKKVDAKKEETKEKEKEKETEETSGKKKTKKIKFDIHQNQTFNDGNDIYVWKYDPTPLKKWLLGLAMVFGSIGVCLFPLWPHEVRLGVYYLSVAAMVFVGVIIFLVALRSLLFGAVWLFTFGKHHFWLLPNLTEDCGFFDSFKPFYSHTFKGASSVLQKNDEEPKHTDEDSKIEKPEEQDDDSNSGGDQDGKISDDDQDDAQNDPSLVDGPTMDDHAGPSDSSEGSQPDDDHHHARNTDDEPVVDATQDSLVESLVEVKTRHRRVKKIH